MTTHSCCIENNFDFHLFRTSLKLCLLQFKIHNSIYSFFKNLLSIFNIAGTGNYISANKAHVWTRTQMSEEENQCFSAAQILKLTKIYSSAS